MLEAIKRLFYRKDVPEFSHRKVFVIYAHAPSNACDESVAIDSFEPPFFPADKIGKFSAQEFSSMAKVFLRADQAANHLYRCTQPDMVPCIVYALDGGRWIQDETATNFFHEHHINY